MQLIELKDAVKIPILGFGTYKLQGEDCISSVSRALNVGYRHIDTAEAYNNQAEIGRIIKNGSIKRSELFITSKIWWTNLSAGNVYKSCYKTLADLQTNYVDLMLIHWPNRKIPVSETLAAMKDLKDQGLIRSIGVSNFTVNHLKDALKAGVDISVNQVEFHPSFYQKELKEFCDENEIVLTAYSPLAKGEDLKLDLVKDLAKKYKQSESAIILNWIMSKNIVAIPRSHNPEHIEKNFTALDFQLNVEDINALDKVNNDNRLICPEFSDFDY